MPLAAPPKAALSVLDGAEHSAMLVRQGAIAPNADEVTASQKWA